jgi:hypothetical protein
MFTKKDDGKYTLDNLTRDLESALVKARRADLNVHAAENAIEQMIRVHRSYIAASLRF